MLRTYEAIYRAGHVELLETPPFQEATRVLVTFIPPVPCATPDPAGILTALENLRKLLAHVPAARSLTDELINERRAEAARD
jgi:hypothetical protein